MEPNYKNWVPIKLIYAMLAGMIGTMAILVLFSFIGIVGGNTSRMVVGIVFGLGFTTFLVIFILTFSWYHIFSHTGKRQLSKHVVEGCAEYIDLPHGGVGLDVGCGSGALTIACAKRNPHGRMMGIDRWGAEYACYNQNLCEDNAKIEGVSNVSFGQDNAIKLSFEDETFDAVTSNYVYHNIGGHNKQDLLLETLRVLKKGGTFAIHDIMSMRRYGDMKAFRQKLLDMGYEKVELIDTTLGKFMTPREARYLMFRGSTLLVGIK